MKIADVIARADSLYPNLYTREEKLAWCYELTCMIYSEYKKEFKTKELAENEPLPDYILPEDIHQVWAGNKRLEKGDDRSFADVDYGDEKIKVIYQVRPEPYREDEWEGTFNFSNDENSGAGILTAPAVDFYVHDLVEIICGDETEQRHVLEVDADNYYLKEPFKEQGEKSAVLKRVLTEETPMPAPYDRMYIDYLLGKIAFYQNDLQEYNKQMISFNNTLDGYAKWYKQTNPLVSGIGYKNMW